MTSAVQAPLPEEEFFDPKPVMDTVCAGVRVRASAPATLATSQGAHQSECLRYKIYLDGELALTVLVERTGRCTLTAHGGRTRQYKSIPALVSAFERCLTSELLARKKKK